MPNNGFGGQQSGSTNMWGSIITALIGAASTYYSGRQADKAQKASERRIAEANRLAEERAEESMLAAEARAEEQRAEQSAMKARAAREAAVPVGESATIDFGASASQQSGSTIDFLVPKLGSTQLKTGSKTGLGV